MDGIGKKIIKDADVGFCASAENTTQLVNHMKRMSKSSEKQREMFSNNALIYFSNNFAKDKLLLKLEKILEN